MRLLLYFMDEKTEARSAEKPAHSCPDSDKAAVGPAWLIRTAPDPVFLGHDLWFKHTHNSYQIWSSQLWPTYFATNQSSMGYFPTETNLK